ncbi:P22 phage major capsid protein family protein [uncultured Agitococcus sp.]|uniref:P22 phage major capsid protein family protein n=1 Tax=uncultured Agitococcus sp. TaxID=1506599 RepID=UPI00261D34CB|nr:P22 phage major capsid protein family protein [uncultured Agitococcus sp.]
MANSILTPSIITKEALRILHAQSNFLTKINRQYDSRFAVNGAKIGTNLDVRLPNKFTVRTGSTYSAQNMVERKVALPVATIKGVDCTITDTELTMSLNDFSDQFLKPAMNQLASDIEYSAMLAMYKSVPNSVGTVSTQIDYKKFQQAGQRLTENLAPSSDRTFLLNPSSRVEFSDAVKGLFQSSSNIDDQYREGMVGRTGGFDVFENTMIPVHTTGTYGGTPLTNGATQGNAGTGNAYVATSDIITDGWTSGGTSLKAGDIVTFAGCYDVHPETKVSTGVLKKFVITTDVSDTTGAITMTVSPGVIAGGAYQNCSNRIADNSAITVLGTSATAYGQNLAFHKDAFTFVSADLDIPKGVDMAARERFGNISMRFVRWFDGDNGQWKSRFDILYGTAALYPELACRLVHQL